MTRSINIPITLLDAAGNPDTTTPVTVSSASPAVRVGLLDPRTAFVDGLQQTGGANVTFSATVGGQQVTDSVLVAVGPAPFRGGITAGTASAEYDTPASR